jgi:CAAX amino terminal protease family.
MQKIRSQNYKNAYIIISSLAACIVLYFIEQSGSFNYIYKTLVKLFFFISTPMIYNRLFETDLHDRLFKRLNFTSIKIGLLLGAVSFVVLIGAYTVLKNQINLEQISLNLKQNVKVTASNFIFVALYITFGNSFIEEFFFRGFIFLKLHRNGKDRTAYIYSSLLFSLYHIMIFEKWFALPIFVLAVIGLAAVGVLFDAMDIKNRTIYNSWLPHIFADSAIMVIGFKMFSLL